MPLIPPPLGVNITNIDLHPPPLERHNYAENASCPFSWLGPSIFPDWGSVFFSTGPPFSRLAFLSLQESPRWLRGGPSWPKMAPRWPQIAPRWPSKSLKTLWKINIFALGLHFGPKQPQDGPRWCQDGPRWPQHGPRWPQDGPRWPQDGPKMAQDGPKMAQDSPR